MRILKKDPIIFDLNHWLPQPLRPNKSMWVNKQEYLPNIYKLYERLSFRIKSSLGHRPMNVVVISSFGYTFLCVSVFS